MSGETNLAKMLATLDPVLDARRFAFSTHAGMSMAEAMALSPIGLFQEAEGLTVISEQGDGPRFAMISLGVHSALEAVGLTAAISRALTDAGLSANMIAGYFHDHIFVPEGDADAAMAVLHKFKDEAA